MANLLSIFLVQMTSRNELAANLGYVAAQFQKAVEQGAELLILPEMFAQFGVSNTRSLAEHEVDFNGPVGSTIRQLAKEFGIWVVAGTVPVLVEEDDRPRARCHVINHLGELVTHYDKIHLFDALVADKQGVYKESDSYSPGTHVVTFESPWGKIGLAVCYDLRFPELFRQLNDRGANLVVVPSAFTYKTGQAHWEVLCRARAIENGFFIAAVNQCGQHDASRKTWGDSMVVDPWGVETSLGSELKSQMITIDLDEVAEVRSKLPVNVHRRLL